MKNQSLPKVKKRGIHLSRCSVMHYIKLTYRSLLLLAVLISFIVNKVQKTGSEFGGLDENIFLLALVWGVFAVEMVLRMFPSRTESMGCEKQFAANYRSAGETEPELQSPWRTFAVFAAWVALNGVIGALYLIGVIDRGVMILIALGYSVCDMVCILFFCPFQTWFMKNKCCTTCRIYNWDYAMMFTPFLFIRWWFTWSLLGLALVLLILWEVRFRTHPERYSEKTNESLRCINCQEKLCHHKKQLQRFLRTQKKFLQTQKDRIIDKGRELTFRKKKK